ncbi:MAG: hypothetical protein ABI383_02410 [Acidobacteriaceae bacterium]
MKQFLIVKVDKNRTDQVAEWVPLPGLFTQQAAEQLIENAMMNNPETMLLMQEVGAA